jgi:hypothetical protein
MIYGTPEHARWEHDLRNAVNAALTAANVVRMLLEKGESQRAIPFVIDIQDACERCRMLFLEAPTDQAN